MAGFHLFSPRSYGELGEPSPGRKREFAAPLGWPEPSVSSWARTPGAETETETRVPGTHQKYSPTGRPRRRGYIASPRESHSLTHVARRPSDRARKHRSGSRRLEEACGEAPTKSGRTWQQRQQPDQPYSSYAEGPGDSSPPYPGGAFSPPSVETLLLEKTHNRDRWAVPVCRPVDLWSPSSILTDKSSPEFGKQPTCMCTQKRGSDDRTESLANQYPQPSASCKESSQHAQVLKSKLDEAMISSRDQKILALVLSRLKKAQKMRELQRQAAVAWEELKRSDQKVHLTLERERRLLLQQSQEQWQGLKELHKPRRAHEQLHQGREQQGPRRDHQAKSTVQLESENGWRVQPDNLENHRGLDKLDRVEAQAEHLKQCQVQRLREQERVLQSLRDLNRLQLRKRLEAACHKRQQHLGESQKKVQESHLSSLVNFQARKVLMDCQAKAEELLRKLSLEQSSQCPQDTQESLAKERHREQQGKAKREAEQLQRVRWRAEEAEEQRQVSKRILAELAEHKIRQARGHAHKTTMDRAQHLEELNILREKNHQILKLKAEKEEKSHIEGIKEAIKKKGQRVQQMARGKDPIFQEFQKVSPASKADRCFDHMAAEAPLPMHQQSGNY
ncbi:coiled-coil domain-containing protein 185 [Onychomys torridus]|uniref:coiled-coil domain-containing protein 185 n=1 Tax=Onychomys torridus TaxID=38674 RepID=UPI00167F81B5|nr:coiled-coil domain-containing protein 185 [Onychomys torridus]